MLHPVQLSDVAKLRHQEDLQRAEAERLYQQLKEGQPGLIQQAGDALITAGQWLKAQASLQPAQPIFSKK